MFATEIDACPSVRATKSVPNMSDTNLRTALGGAELHQLQITTVGSEAGWAWGTLMRTQWDHFSHMLSRP